MVIGGVALVTKDLKNSPMRTRIRKIDIGSTRAMSLDIAVSAS